MKMKSMLMGVLALGCACVFGGESVVAQKLQTCDFLLNKDFKKNAKYYLCLFSASWCGPCRREMPRLAKTYFDTLKADPDIEFIHFSRDQNDEKALAWAKEHDVKFPVVKPKGGNPLDLHSRGIPHLFIVNADGKLLAEGHPASLFTDEKLRALKAGEMTVPETATDKARKAIAKLFPGWSLDTEVFNHDFAGIQANHRGRSNVTFVHPISMEVPAVMSRTVKLSDKNPCLSLCISSANDDADFLLTVRANGKDVLTNRLICTPDAKPWEDVVVPLADCRGSEAKVEVVFTANGWWNEFPYLSRVEVVEGNGDMRIVEGKETVDGYTWSYRAQNGEAEIVAENDGRFSAVSPSPVGSLVIPATLGGATVTHIGRDAFLNCSALTSVTIPESVERIGRGAFHDCTGLRSLKIPTGVKIIERDAFLGCTALTSITIPEGVTSIERGSFDWCCGLASVVIPSSVTHIGRDAFFACRGLTAITIPQNVTDIGWQTFRGCNALTSVTIPASVTNIHCSAFCDTGAMTSFRVEDGNRFYKAENGLLLTKDGTTLVGGVNGDVTIPSGVATVEPNAFEGRVALRTAVIPSGVKSIGDYAFKQCRGMTAVTIPPSVTSIGREAFSTCRGLKSIMIPKGVTVIRNSTFSCSGLTEVTIPSGVKTLERGAFSWCGDLKSVSFPEGLTSIGRDAFYNCGKLTSVTIPTSVTRIEQGAFHGCGSLTSVTIPATLTNNIDRTAFDGCSKLKSVDIVSDGKSETLSFDEFCKLWKPGRQGLLGGSLRARRLQRQDQAAAAKQPSEQTADKAQREAERAEQRQQLAAIQKELKRVRAAKAAEGKETVGGYTWSYRVNNGEAEIVADEKSRCAVSPSPSGHIAIPAMLGGAKVTSVGKQAFSGCGGLLSVEISENVRSIGHAAFYECGKLTSVSFPLSLRTIGDNAFMGCSQLKPVMIPANVTNVGEAAFAYCPQINEHILAADNQSLISVDGVLYTKDGKELMACPSGKTSVNILESVTNILHGSFTGCKALKSLTFPSAVAIIEDWALSGCDVTSITLPQGLSRVEDCLFWGCGNLTEVTIPDSVTRIGWNAFRWCGKLTSVTIPKGVQSIGGEAFYDCGGLVSITMCGERPEAPNDVFKGCRNLKAIHVPANAKSWAGMKEWQGIPLVFDAKAE